MSLDFEPEMINQQGNTLTTELRIRWPLTSAEGIFSYFIMSTTNKKFMRERGLHEFKKYMVLPTISFSPVPICLPCAA